MEPASQSASPLFRGGQSVKVKDWLGGGPGMLTWLLAARLATALGSSHSYL